MVECIKYVRVNRGALLGYVDIYVEKWGVDIYGCSLFQKDGRRWVNLPQREYEKDGETKYWPYIKFREKVYQERFCEEIKNAVDLYCKANLEPIEEAMSSCFTRMNNEEAPF